MKKAILATAAMLTLGGCNFAQLVGGNTVEANQATAATNQAAPLGDKPGQQGQQGQNPPQFASAGVTTSRSLQPGGGQGGKDPGAAGQGLGPGAGIDPGVLVGSWSDSGDCNNPQVEFLSDGSFRAFNGGGGEWQLDGDALTLSGDGGTITLHVRSFDGRVLVAANPNGQLSSSTRC